MKLKELISLQIQDIDELSDCLGKKEYFEKLNKKYTELKERNPVSKQMKSQFYKESLQERLQYMRNENIAKEGLDEL